jgi:hypothetical protein
MNAEEVSQLQAVYLPSQQNALASQICMQINTHHNSHNNKDEQHVFTPASVNESISSMPNASTTQSTTGTSTSSIHD